MEGLDEKDEVDEVFFKTPHQAPSPITRGRENGRKEKRKGARVWNELKEFISSLI